MLAQTFEIKLALLGHVSVGKTTLLNSILGDKFGEVSRKRTTAGINYFRISTPKTCAVASSISNSACPDEDIGSAAKDVLQEITKDNNVLRQTNSIQERVFDIVLDEPIVEMRSDTCLTLVDIPGINEAHMKQSYLDYVKSIWTDLDCVVVVMDATLGVNGEEQIELLRMVKENKDVHKDVPVIVLCNKVDDPDDEELQGMVEEVRREVMRIFKEQRAAPYDYKLILTEFYEKYNKAKTNAFTEKTLEPFIKKTLEQYVGHEERMFAKLARKYNVPNPLDKGEKPHDYKLILTEFYEKYNKAKTNAVIKKTLEQYVGHEEDMFAKLARKYNAPNPLDKGEKLNPMKDKQAKTPSFSFGEPCTYTKNTFSEQTNQQTTKNPFNPTTHSFTFGTSPMNTNISSTPQKNNKKTNNSSGQSDVFGTANFPPYTHTKNPFPEQTNQQTSKNPFNPTKHSFTFGTSPMNTNISSAPQKNSKNNINSSGQSCVFGTANFSFSNEAHFTSDNDEDLAGSGFPLSSAQSAAFSVPDQVPESDDSVASDSGNKPDTCSNDSKDCGDSNLPTFLPISAETAFMYRAASQLLLNESYKLDNSYLEKIGREEVGKYKWKSLSESEKQSIVRSVIGDSEQYQQRLEASNFDKFLKALCALLGGKEAQTKIIEKQLTLALNSISINDGVTSNLNKIYDRCVALEKSTNHIRDEFWSLFAACQTQAFGEFSDDPRKVVSLHKPMNELIMYATSLHKKLYLSEDSKLAKKIDKDRIIDSMKSMLHRQMNLILEKEMEWKPTMPGLGTGTSNHGTRYRTHPLSKWADMAHKDWSIIISSILMLSRNKYFYESFGQQIADLEWLGRAGRFVDANVRHKYEKGGYIQGQFIPHDVHTYSLAVQLKVPGSIKDHSHWGHLAWMFVNFMASNVLQEKNF